MSLLNSASLFSDSIDSSCKRGSLSSQENPSESSPDKNTLGFSSSLILNLDSEADNKSKPVSRLINITQITPGSRQAKKILLPIFYRKPVTSKPSKDLFYLEQSSYSLNKSNETLQEHTETRQEIKRENAKPSRITCTTIGSMHTLSNVDVDFNQEVKDKGRSGLYEGNLIAYCHRCRKETVATMQPEKLKGLRSFTDMIMCCCSSWADQGKILVCPTCSEILLKIN